MSFKKSLALWEIKKEKKEGRKDNVREDNIFNIKHITGPRDFLVINEEIIWTRKCRGVGNNTEFREEVFFKCRKQKSSLTCEEKHDGSRSGQAPVLFVSSAWCSNPLTEEFIYRGSEHRKKIDVDMRKRLLTFSPLNVQLLKQTDKHCDLCQDSGFHI